jgi:hypothetical protein
LKILDDIFQKAAAEGFSTFDFSKAFLFDPAEAQKIISNALTKQRG